MTDALLTDRELASLRNMGNECEAAADEIVCLRAALRVHVKAWDRVHHVLAKHGKHPGRTDDHLADVIDRAIAAPPGWQPIETMPRDGGSYLVADAVRGMVAPHIRGVIHNNPGTKHDWQYGEAVTHWMPLPAAPDAPTVKQSLTVAGAPGAQKG